MPRVNTGLLVTDRVKKRSQTFVMIFTSGLWLKFQ